MIRTLSPQAMQTLEKQVMADTGLPGLLLMEHAAQGVAARLDVNRCTLFLCGPGNNGGDGFAAARLFAQAGGRGEVWRLPGELRGDALTNWELLGALCPDFPRRELGETLPPLPPEAAQGVDALFGTGLARPLEGLARALVEAVNRRGLPMVAVDIPSGLSGGTGEVLGAAVRARETVTFHRPKDGLYLGEGPDYAGEIHICPIGLPHEETPGFDILEPGDLPALLPPRGRNTHKGSYGRVLIRAGSPGMAGAAAICAQAAVKAGAGLVTVCCDETTALTVHTLAPCATCVGEGEFEAAAVQADVIAAGPGLGRIGEGLKGLLPFAKGFAPFEVMKRCGKPCLWDADALNYLAGAGNSLLPLPANHFFTPHPGEAARLLQIPTAQVEADRPAAARALRERLGGTVILKGAVSVLCGREGMALNTRGAPALAKGGSGDALTGILAALMARGLPPLRTAQLACLLHGLAGERAAEALGENGVTALELTNYLWAKPAAP